MTAAFVIRHVWVLTMLGVACSHSGTPDTIVRRMAGERRSGPFVSPHSYEWFVRAELHRERGELRRAVEAYRMALAAPEEDPFVLARLAETLELLGRAEAARETLSRALAIDPRSEAAWMVRGDMLRRAGRQPDALRAYQRARNSAPGSAAPVLALARTLQQMGAERRAAAVLRRFADRAAVGSEEVARARFALALTRGSAREASRAAAALLRVSPADAPRVRRAIERALERERPALARQLLSALPAHPRDNRLRLEVWLEAGDDAAAERLLAGADPSTLGGPRRVARAYLTLGRPGRALEVARVLTLRAPLDDEARVIAARARVALGDASGAARDLMRVPADSKHRAEARAVLRQALAAGGLAPLAREVARTPPTAGDPAVEPAGREDSQRVFENPVVRMCERDGVVLRVREPRKCGAFSSVSGRRRTAPSRRAGGPRGFQTPSQ